MNTFFANHPFMQAFNVAGMHSVPTGFAALFAGGVILLVVWSLTWQGIALWHAARNRQTIWFVVFLLVHTAGILEIIYLLFFRKNKNSNVSTTTVVHTTTVVPPVMPPVVDSSAPPAQ
jgi:hypothetical protein